MGQDRRRKPQTGQITGHGDAVLLGRDANLQGLHQFVLVDLNHCSTSGD
jgi:hypothetical protein